MMRCPDCNKIISLHFPIHDCTPQSQKCIKPRSARYLVQVAEGSGSYSVRTPYGRRSGMRFSRWKTVSRHEDEGTAVEEARKQCAGGRPRKVRVQLRGKTLWRKGDHGLMERNV